MTKAEEIIRFARSFPAQWGTNDPYKIAEKMGFSVMHTDTAPRGFTAHTIKFGNYPTIISINDCYTDFSKKLLCAHELGHALLHEGLVNHFATTAKNVQTNVELEANLFAVALLTDESFDARLSVPLKDMNNYLLKGIIESNLKKR